MAKIGLSNFRYSVLTETSSGPTYAGAKTPGKAISCSVDITSNSATLYADDAVAESDTSFQSGTINIGIDEDDIETMAELLGHTVETSDTTPTTKTLKRNANDAAPYVGLGRVVTKMINGSYQYKVEFIYKVKFSEPRSENNTRGETTEFGTYEIEGTIVPLADGEWSKAQVFSTKTAAIAYLESLLAAPTPPGP